MRTVTGLFGRLCRCSRSRKRSGNGRRSFRQRSALSGTIREIATRRRLERCRRGRCRSWPRAAGGGVVGLLTGAWLMAILELASGGRGWLPQPRPVRPRRNRRGRSRWPDRSLTESGVDEEDAPVYAEGVLQRGHFGHGKGRGQCRTPSRSDPEQRKIVDPAARKASMPGRMVTFRRKCLIRTRSIRSNGA